METAEYAEYAENQAAGLGIPRSRQFLTTLRFAPRNCLARRETRRRIGARTFLSALGDLPRSADKNVRAPARDLNNYGF